MARSTENIRVVLLAATMSCCGGIAAPSQPGGSPSGGSGPAGVGGASIQGGDTPAEGGGPIRGSGGASLAEGGALPQGSGGATPDRCLSVDGNQGYGPIGKPYLLPIKTDYVEKCWTCGLGRLSGFRVTAGYGFVWDKVFFAWDKVFDSTSASWSLNSMITDLSFGAGEPRALVTRDAALNIDVVPSPGGFTVATCSKGVEPEWFQLNSALEVLGGASRIAPDVPCGGAAPRLLWTGEGYLTSFVDARGLVVALLDERGATVREEVLSQGLDDPGTVRFSQNGDRVLFALVRCSGGQAQYGVLDLKGALTSGLQALDETDAYPCELAVATSGEGWLVATDYGVSSESGFRLTQISRDGLVAREGHAGGGYVPWILDLTPSAYGGFLYLSVEEPGGMYSSSPDWYIGRIDGGLEPVYEERRKSWDYATPFGAIRDPDRDLIVQESSSDGTISVQEYGWCPH